MQPLDFEVADFESADFEAAEFGAVSNENDPLAGVEYGDGLEQDCKRELSAVAEGFIARAKQEQKRREKATDSEYWVCLCFQSREQVEEFLRLTQWGPRDAKYLDGQKVARKIGVDLTPESIGFGKVKIDPKLAVLAMEE